jgi:hypothetical protein
MAKEDPANGRGTSRPHSTVRLWYTYFLTWVALSYIGKLFSASLRNRYGSYFRTVTKANVDIENQPSSPPPHRMSLPTLTVVQYKHHMFSVYLTNFTVLIPNSFNLTSIYSTALRKVAGPPHAPLSRCCARPLSVEKDFIIGDTLPGDEP